MKYVPQNHATEWAYLSGKAYADPFNEVRLDVVVTRPDGTTQTVPAFWAGEQTWRVRYASSQVGTHHYRTVCSDEENADLHDQAGRLEVTPYEGQNSLLQHGPLRVAGDRRHLQHQDGTPFFWLGDTWWMGLCKRLHWPDEFQALTADRVAKGFTLIQIVAGLYPDMEPFDPRGMNEAGFPWERDFTRINPAYFDMADLRIAHLVRSGLVPCIVGSWGFFMDFAGPEVLRRHWHYLIARYGAYPVVWCTAGEGLMPYYLHREFRAQDETWQNQRRAAWSALMRDIRAMDPYGHPITIHPTRYGRDQVDDPTVMDLEWLQTGHSGYTTLANTVNMLEESLAAEPKMPVLVSEVNYEGIMESSREEIQRFLFWTCLLSGAAGHTYGANGLWQVNGTDQPYGPSPHGTSWGDIPWHQAAQLPGSRQVGLGRQFLERYPWWNFTPQPAWIAPHHQTPENRMLAYAAGIPGQVRVIFIPAESIRLVWSGEVAIRQLEPEVTYQACYWNPKTGQTTPLGTVEPDAEGTYPLPKPPIFQDWVVVLEAMK